MNNRELASAIWIALLLAFALSRRDLRAELWSIVKLASGFTILVPALLYATVLCALILVAGRVGLWEPALLGETLIWFFLAGAVLLFRVTDAAKDTHFFRRRALGTVGAAAFFEFFINLRTMALPWELVLQPVIVVFALMQVMAASEQKFRPAKRLVGILLAPIVLGLIVFTIHGLVTHRDTQDYELLLRSLALPIWLTLGALPAIYSLALFAGYERAFKHMNLHRDGRRAPLPVAFGVVAGLKTNLADINGFVGHRTRAAGLSGSFREARREVSRFKEDRQKERDREQGGRERLARYAGVDGIDDSGRRLDQREFQATKDALHWLANCHMGWFRQRGEYRSNLMNVLGDLSRHGLPNDHGIIMHVRSDGSAWYAYRQTAGGWTLGIGAAAAPPDEWLYDGGEPPSGYPGEDPVWGDRPFATPPNWRGDHAWDE